MRDSLVPMLFRILCINSQSCSSVKVEDVYLDPARIAAMKTERIQKEKAEALVSLFRVVSCSN